MLIINLPRMSKSTVSAIPFGLQIAQPCLARHISIYLSNSVSFEWYADSSHQSLLKKRMSFNLLMTESNYISWTTVSVVFKALKKSWKTLDLLVCVPARRGLIASLIRKYMNLTEHTVTYLMSPDKHWIQYI